jgi:hypothetical protein
VAQGWQRVSLIKKLLAGVIILALLAGLSYLGACIYFNMTVFQPIVEVPDAYEAKYSFKIVATGNTLLTDEYTQEGTDEGSRKFTLHGFWELTDDEFEYNNGDITLDETYFGEIKMRYRQ